MVSADRIVRTGLGVLLAGLLVLTPGLAEADFDSDDSASLSMSTLSLDTPSSVDGTYACPGHGTTGVTVDLDAPATADEAGLQVRLIGPDGTVYTKSLAADGGRADGGRVEVDHPASHKGRWTVEVRSRLGSWSSEPAVKVFDCDGNSGKSGEL